LLEGLNDRLYLMIRNARNTIEKEYGGSPPGRGAMLAELTMFPLGRVSGLSGEISKVLDLVEKSGLPYQLTAMGTLIEGEWDAVLDLVTRCRNRLLEDNERLYIVLKIDDHKERTGKLTGKVAAVENKLGRALKK